MMIMRYLFPILLIVYFLIISLRLIPFYKKFYWFIMIKGSEKLKLDDDVSRETSKELKD
jgi:hypothetical protein